MLTYILNNRSGAKDAYGNTFIVELNGKSTRTVETALIRSARLTLPQAAQGDGTQEHILMHSRALTSTGNTRFFHLVNGRRTNDHIVATLRKRGTNNGLYDEFELDHSYQLHLQHPIHTLDFYFTDNHGTAIPVGQGEDVTTTVWSRDASFYDVYKEELNVTYDSTGTIELVVDNVNYTWAETNSTSGTITGPTNSTWTRSGNFYTILWGGNSATWYKLEVNSANKKQLLATEDYNDIHSPGTLIWEKASGHFANAASVTFSDNGDNTGSIGNISWLFSTVTGYFTLTTDPAVYTTVCEAFLGTSDLIRWKLVSSDDTQYTSVSLGTVLYREDVSTVIIEPVSSAQVTGPANNWYGEDIGIHVELDARHKST